MINKTNYKEISSGTINNIKLIEDTDDFDYKTFYESNKNLFLEDNVLCGLDNKILSDDLGNKSYGEYDRKFKDVVYDNTSTVKKDFICPKDHPYPYDTIIKTVRANKNIPDEYDYEVVKSRNKCCDTLPIPHNESLYDLCEGNHKPCKIGNEEGKCNIFNIQKGLCIDKNILDSESDKVFRYEDKITHPSKIRETLSERMTFYVRPYFCSGRDSQKETLNISECLPTIQ